MSVPNFLALLNDPFWSTLLIVFAVFALFYPCACRRRKKVAEQLAFLLKQQEEIRRELSRVTKGPRRNSNASSSEWGNHKEKEQEEVTTFDANKVYVGNIDYSATEEELAALFSECGMAESVKIPTERHSGRGRGFGFVTFASATDSDRAVALNGSSFKGRVIQVTYAKGKEGQ